MTTLTFQNTTLSVVDQNNQKWLPALEVGRALGYSNPSVSISQLYDRNKDEFTSSMTAIIEMDTASGMQKVRIFSLRGCWLLGMRSHTKVAKEFRKWVLDILDKEIVQPQQLSLPSPEPKYSRELTERQWLKLASLWFTCYNNLELLGKIYKPLEALGSHYGVQAYTHYTEYQTTLGTLKRILEPLLADFNVDPHQEAHYALALRTLREYEPKGLGAIVRI